ncbi:MAG: lysoplasmalogenase [Clostridia bacterium]|nr:lysoplasmalogenase [Clostridia bacterium]
MQLVFIILFVAASLLHLYSRLPEKGSRLAVITKPLLMPLLLGCYLTVCEQPALTVYLAMIFSFIGDVFLLYPERKITRLLGFSSFFLAQISYIVHYIGLVGAPGKTIIILAVICYVSAYLISCLILFPNIPKKWKIPVSIYMLAISGMSFMALMTFFTRFSNWMGLALFGSGMFICSDFILCMEIFKEKTRYGNFIVMLTYIVAQAAIVFGLANIGGLFY